VIEHNKIAILAGGCFWGMQDLIRKQPGVVSTRVGYTGGQNAHPTYRNHPGHAEAIEITYDPDQTDYRILLIFLSDPRPHYEEPTGQRHRKQLSFGDLLSGCLPRDDRVGRHC
jgi:peptide methionine sulfoxide reductase MsrA